MEDLNNEELRLIVHHFSLFTLLISGIKVEPTLKVVSIVEDLRHQKVKQTP